MRNSKNKIFEDFFDDIDSDEMIDSEVEETNPMNVYKEYSHSFGIDCPITSQKISPVQSKQLIRLLSYIELSEIFRRYCLKIALCSSIYKPNENENTIIKTFEFNPDMEISSREFVNDWVDCITKMNDMRIIHYHFTFDINTSISFSKFVLFYINVSKLLSCVSRKQSLDKPSWNFNYYISGTIYDEKYRIFEENTWETLWELTDSSKYCEILDTFYKMFCDFGCSASVSKKDIDKIRENGTIYMPLTII